MKDTNREIELRLGRAVERRTPEVLQSIERRLESPEGKVSVVEPAPKSSARATLRLGAGLAAMLMLVLGVNRGLDFFTPVSTVSLDVNPSVELRVNKAERVLAAVAHNADAEIILTDMDLKYVDLDVAVNALIGSMVRNGYLNEIRNSILITVDSREAEGATHLQQRLSEEVDRTLAAYAVQGAVLSQTLAEDAHLKELAEQHGISQGKAALVDQLVRQNDTLDFAGVAAMPINDINLLIGAKQTPLQGVESRGQASSAGTIGQQRAKEIAFERAGASEADATWLNIELDYDDGRLVYEIDFVYGGTEYETEIDATTGDILGFESERRGAALPAAVNTAIGTDRALELALENVGLQASEVTVVKRATYERAGRAVVDLEFSTAATRYSFVIDGTTGEVLERHLKELDQGGGQTVAPSGSSTRPSDVIGAERAKSIALDHAGVAASSLREYDCELDYERLWGRWVYEVDFESGAYEYEYDIDAETGEIFKQERKADDDHYDDRYDDHYDDRYDDHYDDHYDDWDD